MANLGDVSVFVTSARPSSSLSITPDAWPDVSRDISGGGSASVAAVGLYLRSDGSVASGSVPSGTGKLIAFAP